MKRHNFPRVLFLFIFVLSFPFFKANATKPINKKSSDLSRINIDNFGFTDDTAVKSLTSKGQWIPQLSGTPKGLSSIFFVDKNTGYAVGDKGTILKTTDGGEIWSNKSSDTTNLRAVSFINSNTGFAVGHPGGMISVYQYQSGVLVGILGVGGRILKTTDAGATWSQQTMNESLGYMRSIDFVNGNTGYAVGHYGTVLRTNNGGNTWDYIHLPDTPSGMGYYSHMLNAVNFTDSNTGYAVGYAYAFCGSPYHCYPSYEGIILKTTNGGNNWELIYVGASYRILNSVTFTDASTGFVVGNNGTILKTITGGNSWDNISSGTTNHLTSVCFTDKYSGYISGAGGTLLQTTDGGSTWVPQTGGEGADINSVFFTDVLTGYAAGSSGTILKYSGTTSLPQLETRGNLMIFPNPTESIFNIQFTEPMGTDYEVELFNNMGIIIQKAEYDMNQLSLKIDLSDHPAGVYIIRIKSGTRFYESVIVRK